MKYFIILISLLILSALFILLKEKAYDEDNIESPEFFDKNSASQVQVVKKDIKKRGILIFDISGLSVSAVSDSLRTPFLTSVRAKSEFYENTFNLSTDRLTSLKSFIECVPPYKMYDEKEPFLIYKKIIADSLRNSSMPKVFENAGFSVKLFSSDTIAYRDLKKYFKKVFLAGSKKGIVEKIYKEISNDSVPDFIYFVDLGKDSGEINYFENMDRLTGELIRTLNEVLGVESLCLFISTEAETNYSPCVSFFYRNGIEISSDTTFVSITDIGKTLLNLTKVRYPNYFGGYDIDNFDGENLREYFAGSVGDTLLLFNENFAYKSIKHSPYYSYCDIRLNKDVTKENLRINEKYEQSISRYFGGDYIKYVILKNNSEATREFKFNIRSKRRFEELSDISNYYIQTTKNYRYTKDFSRKITPGSSDTIKIYYASMYQEFLFKFDSRYNISYGASGINAGYTDAFDENSYYGMKFGNENEDLFINYDVKIFNLRVNY